MELENKRVVVIGTGISGIAAAKLLHKNKASIVLFDGNKDLNKEDLREKVPKDIDYDLVLGDLGEADLEAVDLAVFSPGVPLEQPFVELIRKKNIKIWGEIERGENFIYLTNESDGWGCDHIVLTVEEVEVK